jgi:hypothetical protein
VDGGPAVEDFAAVDSRLSRSGSISAKQGRARQGGRSAEVKEIGADLGRLAGRRSATEDGGDGGGSSAACTEISVRVRLRLPQLLGSLHRRHHHSLHCGKATCISEIGIEF